MLQATVRVILVGTVLIALMVFSGFVYAFAFDGFNVETTTGGEVEAWLAAASDGSGSGRQNNKEEMEGVYRIK